jgi:hypothetical protein
MNLAAVFIKPKTWLLILFFFVGTNAYSQEIIDEDFLEILSRNAQEAWHETDPDFAVNMIPEKWMNESAVAIAYKKHILFDKKRSGLLGGKENLLVVERKQMKVKLLDKRAVENFSELYFRYSSKFDGFSAVVYKSDGEKKQIPLTKAVSIEDNDNVPEFFKSFFDQNVRNRHEYYKVPVADLLPGDILEFISITSSTLNVKKTPYYEFDPQYELCQKSMPVLTHKIIVETDNNSFITARSINGAPEFKQTTNGDFNVYTWIDKNRDRSKDLNFVNEYMVLPLVKFQIIYTDGHEFKTLFAGVKGQMKSNFDVSEIGAKAFANYSDVGKTYVYGSEYATVDAVSNMLWAKMKSKDAKNVSEDEFIRMAYYYIRHTQVFNQYYYSDKQFCYLLGQLLYTRKIQSEIIVTTPNNLTSPTDLLFESELAWCLRVKGKYIFKASEYSNVYDLNEAMINNDGYKLPVNSKEKTESVKIIDSKYDENKGLYQLYVSVDTSLKWLDVDRTSAYTGIHKERNSYSALHFTPYMLTDAKTFDGPDDFGNAASRYLNQIDQQKQALIDEFNERKPEYMKNQLEDDLGTTVKYKEFKMVTEGRTFGKAELMYKEKFQVDEKIRKAGKKLLINLPGLMGSQLQIRNEERTRNFDIDISYPRKLKWQINLTIPGGYTVEGFDNLNSKVDNETGSFTTTAKVDGNTLILEIEKLYKQKNVSKDKWPQMLEFIDAAYNFTHKYVLLKPLNN